MQFSQAVVDAAKSMRDAEQKGTLVFALAFFLFTLVVAIGYSIWAALAALALTEYTAMLAWVFGGGAFFVFSILLIGMLRAASIVSGVMQQWHLWQEAERAAKYPLPQLPTPALTLPTPQEIEVIPVASGDRVVEMPKELLFGFDPRDLEYLCRYLANGGRFTEAAMEKLLLPYALVVMGKASEGTLYTRFMELCVECGIIVGRVGKQAGTLAVLEAGEMLKRIKELNNGKVFV